MSQLIADLGYYAWVSAPGELAARVEDGTVEELLASLMRARLEQWMALAAERLKVPAFWMLGNDDPPALAEVLDSAPPAATPRAACSRSRATGSSRGGGPTGRLGTRSGRWTRTT